MANNKEKKQTTKGRDYPLAPTPAPAPAPKEKGSMSERREQAYSADMSKYGYVTDATVEKFKK
jgi:hypothetical protein